MTCKMVVSFGVRLATIVRPTSKGMLSGAQRVQDFCLATGWVVENSTISGDHPVEQVQARKHVAQIVQLASGDEK